jgi:hypothetical protein
MQMGSVQAKTPDKKKQGEEKKTSKIAPKV